MEDLENELQKILNTIESIKYDQVNSPDLLMNFGFGLQGWIAYSAQAVAVTKKLLHDARRKAMLNLLASLSANAATMPISLQKDYVNDLCAEHIHLATLADRCNSACIHSLDFVRTCLATLRQEREQSREFTNTKQGL